MFTKGPIKGDGIDITLRNNSDHFLAPNDWDMVMGVKFGKISVEEYKTWYMNLIRSRWETRKEEFIALAKEGIDKDIKLKCFCLKKFKGCHAHLASKFMNAIVDKLNK